MDISAYADIVPDIFLFVDRRSFPDWEIIRQEINFHDLTFIVGGKADYYVNGKKYTAEKGDLIYVPPGSIREANTYKENPMHSYAFNFWLSPSNDLHLPFQTVTRSFVPVEVIGYVKEFAQVWMTKQRGYEIQARGLFLLILHRLLSVALLRGGSVQTDDRIAKVRAYIAEHYMDNLNLDTVASLVGLHPVYISKLFKQDTNYSFKQFLNLIRVNNAEMMLKAGGFTVSEVAERCGYDDISYFSNVFKSVKGYSPSTVLKKV
ncbi:AraC family transcriptional regulator [Paenibacillus chartarius]|uniref:AraC family transcriptional regulator n=1 Tax=Paenibacillus chartarius TaxID=747481 RepID=A0ABV6DPK9_9BACL